MEVFQLKNWFKLSLIGLFLVASLGLIMRYKIAYSLPWINQKNLQMAHSNLAFLGWISHSLWIFIVQAICKEVTTKQLQSFNILLRTNLIGIMLLSTSLLVLGNKTATYLLFSLQLIINLLLIFFTYQVVSKSSKKAGHQTIQFSLAFQLLAILGNAALIVLLASKTIYQQSYLIATYWHLHFSYNGWFLFACLGLWQRFAVIGLNQTPIPQYWINLMAISCIPAYGLSILWLKLPIYIYIPIVLSALVQIYAWIKILYFTHTKHSHALKQKNLISYYLFALVLMAMSVKCILQLGSVIPAVSKLAFGFRPIVIAYLHLILLGVISLFIVSYAYINQWIPNHKFTQLSIAILCFGILANELILAIQGIASFSYTIIPFSNEGLLFAAIILWIASLMLWLSNTKNTDNN
jgi:hypothetical protein